ncbi:inositol monophosphatase family protein [Corynebacterium epidermidicanis]|nr:inositol monophosphatase family protein [Corynebacterium epidermidicanis]
MTNYEELKDIAVEIAVLTATEIARKRAELGDVRAYTQTKSSPVDPVTVVDTFAEELISGELERLRPADGLIGEEGSSRVATSEVTWIVDPIDGTVNFLYGLPQYAVSIAAAVDGQVVAGAVINVATGELFSAAAGRGATRRLNGVETVLQASQETQVRQSLVATGFGYSATRRQAQSALVARLLPQIRDIRRLGSAALDLCMVAAGEVDAHFEHGLNAWDFAAGALIAAEAGAKVRTPSLSTPGDAGEIMLVTAPGIWDEFHGVLDEIGACNPVAR